jgi:hypothetical protein
MSDLKAAATPAKIHGGSTEFWNADKRYWYAILSDYE